MAQTAAMIPPAITDAVSDNLALAKERIENAQWSALFSPADGVMTENLIRAAIYALQDAHKALVTEQARELRRPAEVTFELAGRDA